jgi:sugar lactone lactonase YvrE
MIMELTRRRANLAVIVAAAAMLVIAAPMAAAAATGSKASAGAAGTLASGRAGIISTVAGGLGGPGAGRTVAVAGPCGVTSDGRNLYFTEGSGNLVRGLDQGTDALTTVAGTGTTILSSPCAMTTDPSGNVVYADTGNNVLRVIAARNGTFYGRKMRAGRSYVIGGSSFTSPDAVAADRHGNLLVGSQTTYQTEDGPEPGTAVVFVLAGARGRFYGQSMVPGHVYPLVGQQCPGASPNGCQAGLGGDGGTALAATLGAQLWGLTTDRSGNVVISDNGNSRIRVVAERTGTFYGLKMTAGHIYEIAGGGTSLGDGGPARLAGLNSPKGVVFDRAGNLIVCDSGNGPARKNGQARNRIRVVAERTGRFYGRRMTAGDIYTIAGGGTSAPSSTGDGGAAVRAKVFQPSGLSLDHDGNLVIADQGQNKLVVLPARTGRYYGQHMTAGHLYTVAGNGSASYSGDGGLATRAELSPFSCLIQSVEFGPCSDPAGLAVGNAGNIVVADSANNRVRVIARRDGVFYGLRMTARHIYTVAGTGVAGFSGDDGLATRATLNRPGGVTVDKAGNILVSDAGNGRIRVIANRTGRFYGRNMITGHIYYLAGGGFSGGGGIPPSKAALEPWGLAIDRNGNVLIAAGGPKVLAEKTGTFYGERMKAGLIYNMSPTYSGGTSLAPLALAVDHAGNVVVASGEPNEIAVIAVRAGTFYGTRMSPDHVYNVAPTVKFGYPSGIAVDAAGNVLIADTLDNRVEVLAERPGSFYGIKMRAGHVYTVAGGGHHRLGDGGPATAAELSTPCGIATYGTGLLVLDDGNGRVREVTG